MLASQRVERYSLCLIYALLIYALATGAPAAPTKASGAINVDANKIVRLKAELTSPDDLVFWTIDKEDVVDAEELPGGKLYFTGPTGTYKVKCVVVPVKDGKIAGGQQTTRYTIVIGKPPPGPTPDPDPTPPGPVPIPGPGFRTLIVFESADATSMPAAQQNVLYGKTVRDYLDSKCVVGPDGKTKEWRIYDKDVDLRAESTVWQNAMKRAKEDKGFKTPWIIISNPEKGTGFEGPLPADVNSTMELLKKYGG